MLDRGQIGQNLARRFFFAKSSSNLRLSKGNGSVEFCIGHFGWLLVFDRPTGELTIPGLSLAVIGESPMRVRPSGHLSLAAGHQNESTAMLDSLRGPPAELGPGVNPGPVQERGISGG
jgi:hypothetical protein